MSAATALDPKVIATWRARAALVGVVLTVIEGDRGEQLVVVSRGALTKTLSPSVVESWLRMAGAPE